MPLQIVIDAAAIPAFAGMLETAINQHNVVATGHDDYVPVGIWLKDEQGEVLGGLIGHIWGGWLYMALLWLPLPVRCEGYGAALLAAAEQIARDHGCTDVWLDSFSFQASGFYQTYGYEVFGRLDEFPPGHQRYFLKKHLS